jgi:hypothetical protein
VPSREVASGLDADYAARQRQSMSQRYASWGGGGFSGLDGGRLGGGGRR